MPVGGAPAAALGLSLVVPGAGSALAGLAALVPGCGAERAGSWLLADEWGAAPTAGFAGSRTSTSTHTVVSCGAADAILGKSKRIVDTAMVVWTNLMDSSLVRAHARKRLRVRLAHRSALAGSRACPGQRGVHAPCRLARVPNVSCVRDNQQGPCRPGRREGNGGIRHTRHQGKGPCYGPDFTRDRLAGVPLLHAVVASPQRDSRPRPTSSRRAPSVEPSARAPAHAGVELLVFAPAPTPTCRMRARSLRRMRLPLRPPAPRTSSSRGRASPDVEMSAAHDGNGPCREPSGRVFLPVIAKNLQEHTGHS